MAVIESLWKEDASRGDPSAGGSRPIAVPLGGATNSNDTDPDPSSSLTEETFDDGRDVSGPGGVGYPQTSHLVAEFQVSWREETVKTHWQIKKKSFNFFNLLE